MQAATAGHVANKLTVNKASLSQESMTETDTKNKSVSEFRRVKVQVSDQLCVVLYGHRKNCTGWNKNQCFHHSFLSGEWFHTRLLRTGTTFHESKTLFSDTVWLFSWRFNSYSHALNSPAAQPAWSDSTCCTWLWCTSGVLFFMDLS